MSFLHSLRVAPVLQVNLLQRSEHKPPRDSTAFSITNSHELFGVLGSPQRVCVTARPANRKLVAKTLLNVRPSPWRTWRERLRLYERREQEKGLGGGLYDSEAVSWKHIKETL